MIFSNTETCTGAPTMQAYPLAPPGTPVNGGEIVAGGNRQFVFVNAGGAQANPVTQQAFTHEMQLAHLRPAKQVQQKLIMDSPLKTKRTTTSKSQNSKVTSAGKTTIQRCSPPNTPYISFSGDAVPGQVSESN